MPGVGVTDAQTILERVSQQRLQVAVSVVLQLLSAACYAPALVGVVSKPALGADRQVRWAATLLLVGAMGSAADAVFHLLAFAMTAPDLDHGGFAALMAIMQGPGLRFVLPMIAAFFVGSVWLSIALARMGVVSRWNPWLYALAPAIGVLGGFIGPLVGLTARAVGLAVLAVVAGAQIQVGLELRRTRDWARTRAA